MAGVQRKRIYDKQWSSNCYTETIQIGEREPHVDELQWCSILGLFTAHCFYKRDVVFQLNILAVIIEISLLLIHSQ